MARRSRRFPFISPVEATWQDVSGKVFREPGQATEVNAHGGLLDLRTYPAVGKQIELTNLLSHETTQARVVGIRRTNESQVLGVAVELLIPSETFWGVNFQLKRTCADLVKLEYDMRSGPLDQRVLREFRDAVDNVRKTAWAVQEWQERQSRHHDPQTVLALLALERIRRATQLLEAIATDTAAQEISSQAVGLEDFLRAVERVRQTLVDRFKGSQRLTPTSRP